MKHITLLFALISIILLSDTSYSQSQTGNVIFIHPDGTSLSNWNALRILTKGPDGELNWDKLPNIALYQGHANNTIVTSSNAGATAHAFGKKANYESYGLNKNDLTESLSGKPYSIMIEAQNAGIAVGVINSGSIVEPGSGVFLTSAENRKDYQEITEKIIKSGADLTFSGGEEWLLPANVKGRFVEQGKRTDGLDLIEYAKESGYTVVYNRDEMNNVSLNTTKVLGVFAAIHTFNDMSEEEQLRLGLPNYSPSAPTVSEMTEFAVKFLSAKGQFFLVVEEEGTDNFGNSNNAKGFFEALNNADNAIKSVREFIQDNPRTLLIVASDSEASGMGIISGRNDEDERILSNPITGKNGAPIDGADGPGTRPFYSTPDKFGNSHPFLVVWSTNSDVFGGVVARAEGLNSDRMKGKVDNTDIYRMMYLTLFGQWLD